MTEGSKPLVSVVMATFNEKPNMVGKAIESILSQTYQNFELFVLDDSTAEETKQKIDSYSSDSRVHVIRESNRMKFVPALNKGLKLASGKYIARMDGDDIALPDRFEKQVNYLEENKDVAVLGGHMNIIDENDAIKSERLYATTDKAFLKYAIFRNPIAHPTVMFRKQLVDKGFTYDETLKRSEDLDLWLRLLKAGYKLKNLDEKILNYRVLSQQMKKRGRDQWKYNLKIRKRNFTFKHFGFSLCSVCVSFLYNLIPNFIFEMGYNKENKIYEEVQ